MFNYVDKKTQVNNVDYIFKGFADSYDHGNKKEYQYDWINMKPGQYKQVQTA